MDLFSYVAYLVWIYEMWKKPFSKQNWLAWLLRGFPEAVVKICEIRGPLDQNPDANPAPEGGILQNKGIFLGGFVFRSVVKNHSILALILGMEIF